MSGQALVSGAPAEARILAESAAGSAKSTDPLRETSELRLEVTLSSPFRLPRMGGADGVLRHRGGVLERLLHQSEEPVLVRVAQTSSETVLFGARSRSRDAARYGIERMRFALGIDDELSTFYREFSEDPLIGRSIRQRPWLRVRRRPEPFEALAWAVCEQLIEFDRAAAIERRIVSALGPRCPYGSSLRDVPSAAAIAGETPARFESFDLSGSRARLLVRVAREVASGRVDLHDAYHERGWYRLRAIRGIGPWTVEMLALHGQGRYDQIPAGDLGLLKYVGRQLSGGDPHAYAEEDQVRSFFEPYGRWVGLAAVHMLAA